MHAGEVTHVSEAAQHSTIALRSLRKVYGSQVVVEDVSFTLAPGQITALLGENGAGKSTLAKILAGSVSPDGGEILLGDDRLRFDSPRDALSKGFAIIPQELIYVPNLTVAENICLGRWPGRGFLTSQKQMLRTAAEQAASLGFTLPLNAQMKSLSFAQQQAVEIVKALSRDAQLIILDEPTAALNSEESERLLELMRGVAEGGAAIMYISHRLDEVFRACTDVVVLRNGRKVFDGAVSQTDPSAVIGHILGRAEVAHHRDSSGRDASEVCLTATDLTREAYPPIRGVDIQVGKTEIVGLYGLAGSGAEVIAEALGGLHDDVTGTLAIDGETVPIPRSPRRARRQRIGYVPADRKLQGLVPTMSVLQSISLLVLNKLSRFGFMNRRAEREMGKDLASRTLLRARSLDQKVSELSGGNQQKVMMASRIAQVPSVLVLQEPTRGVDIGARVELHNMLRELANAGTGQLVVTSDIEEAVILSDRLLVLRDGRIVHEIVDPSEESQNEAIQAAGGV